MTYTYARFFSHSADNPEGEQTVTTNLSKIWRNTGVLIGFLDLVWLGQIHLLITKRCQDYSDKKTQMTYD